MPAARDAAAHRLPDPAGAVHRQHLGHQLRRRAPRGQGAGHRRDRGLLRGAHPRLPPVHPHRRRRRRPGHRRPRLPAHRGRRHRLRRRRRRPHPPRPRRPHPRGFREDRRRRGVHRAHHRPDQRAQRRDRRLRGAHRRRDRDPLQRPVHGLRRPSHPDLPGGLRLHRGLRHRGDVHRRQRQRLLRLRRRARGSSKAGGSTSASTTSSGS